MAQEVIQIVVQDKEGQIHLQDIMLRQMLTGQALTAIMPHPVQAGPIQTEAQEAIQYPQEAM